MKNDTLLKEKWGLFEKRASLFAHIPFVDFVLAAGSMALGTARVDSDFDVIVGVQQGRIFTVRFLSVIVFGMYGWRRSAKTQNVKDKICLNHFTTPAAYRKAPPYDPSWKALYSNLVPLLGNHNAIEEFFRVNDWTTHEARSTARCREARSIVCRVGEYILGGSVGAILERLLRYIQVRRITYAAHHAEAHKPVIICTNEQLVFHPDTRSRLRSEPSIDRA